MRWQYLFEVEPPPLCDGPAHSPTTCDKHHGSAPPQRTSLCKSFRLTLPPPATTAQPLFAAAPRRNLTATLVTRAARPGSCREQGPLASLRRMSCVTRPPKRGSPAPDPPTANHQIAPAPPPPPTTTHRRRPTPPTPSYIAVIRRHVPPSGARDTQTQNEPESAETQKLQRDGRRSPTRILEARNWSKSAAAKTSIWK